MRAKKGICLFAALACMMSVFYSCANSNEEVREIYVDLEEYYGIEKEGQYGIVVDGRPVGTAVEVDGKVYLPQETVAKEINSQFYYDKENNQIRFAMPSEVKTIVVDGTSQAISYDGGIYLDMDYVTANSEVMGFKASEPNRVVFFKDIGRPVDTYEVAEEVPLRSEASDKSSIMADLSEGQKLYGLEEVLLYGNTVKDETETEENEHNGWLEVVTEQGIRGYIREESARESTSVTFSANTPQPEYSHISMDGKVCLGWQLMTNKAGNDDIRSKINGAKGLNVISPTWYVVSDAEGGITSYASSAYVTTAHNRGIQVWPLINDFSTDEEGKSYVLGAISTTAGRTAIIDSLMEEAETYGFDGINVDFEKIDQEHGADYVQFMRELSVACRNKGIILSVDMYVPMSYNQHYGRGDVGKVVDYLIVMGYDEHWAGCGEAGSVASINYVRNGINNTVKCVDADRVMNAIPFYTRIWSETPEDISDGSGIYVEDTINGNYYLKSRALGMNAAENELEAAGKDKIWLDSIGQYYGEYEKDGVLYRTWLEEERSIELKLSFMEQAGLGGVACWQLGFEKKAIWEVITEYLNK